MGWEACVPSSKKILEDMAQIPNYSILMRIQARGAVVHRCGHFKVHINDSPLSAPPICPHKQY
eukprot:134484-Ditylum_brightwellii.AAC.1